uniref:Nck-associated protein 5 C-terminal domain-containing protein n=1 Tax=Esox lucius TaxID=8010 RepID=A0A6Q2XGJ7_ESOLU
MESEDSELRECDDPFESEEGDVEPYLEPQRSRELMERLRELEAENSALALANESQREAYERCLDEVANHVVQALLNQKDLREECIKLKMRVFDLERQNRTLTELFAQKLHPQSIPLPQVQHVLSTQRPCIRTVPSGGIRELPLKCTSSSRAPVNSMEALSPFFKKKAHILEALRQLEESDPLKFHSSTCLFPHHDLGQALVSMERDQMSPGGLLAPQQVGNLLSRCLECLNGQAWEENQGASAQSSGPPHAPALPHHLSTDSTTQCYMHKTALDSVEHPLECLGSSDSFFSSLIQANLNGMLADEPRKAQRHKEKHLSSKPLPPPRAEVQLSQSEDVKHREKVAVESYSPAPVPDRISSAQVLPPSGKSKLPLSPPSPSPALVEVKPSPISSPSRLLKFLKIPTGINQPQPGNPLRLSPQLTRSSKIPCRNNNNYEVYHSPILNRKATTMEREKQSYSSASKTDPYPATHSAPTSPPKQEECPSLPSTAKEIKLLSPPSPQPPDSSQVMQEHSTALELSPQNCELAPPTQSATRRGDPSPGSSTPKRQVKPHGESSHHPFKERLAALGKLKTTEDLSGGTQSMDKKDAQSKVGKPPTNNIEKSKTAERQSEKTSAEQYKNQKYTDSLDGKPYPKTSFSIHPRVPAAIHESGTKSSATSSSIPKEQETLFPTRMYVAKAEGPKIKMGTSSSNTETPPVVRNYGKCPITQSHQIKTAPSPQNSPTKVPSKSPSKVGQASSYPRGVKPIHEERALAPRHQARPEDKGKVSTEATAKEDKKPYSSGPSVPHSAIEQKVMRGIEENMLKLQEQDRGQVAEPKHKASNGIASWFGLRKSKLPALSRKPEVSKLKINMPSSSSLSSAAGGVARDPKTGGPRKVVESLNISKLMEKAEDLRKALEEERAYVNGVGMERSAMDPAQGQLSLVYRDGPGNPSSHCLLKEHVVSVTGFGLTWTVQPLLFQGSVLIGKDEVASDESFAESISSQHFTGSGASMRTLDSGIGTFPMPDYASSAAGKSIPKGKLQGEQGCPGSQGKHGAIMKVPRKARTLERELSSLDEVNSSVLYGTGLEGKGPNMHVSNTIHEGKYFFVFFGLANWTFPNLKGSTGASDVYLDMQGEPGSQGTPSRRVSAF